MGLALNARKKSFQTEKNKRKNKGENQYGYGFGIDGTLEKRT